MFEAIPIRRSAAFVGPLRIRLTREWSDGPRALVIGCNPSIADAETDDPTSRWWNRWFRQAGFGGYDAANLYPFCTSNPRECRAIVEGQSAETCAAIALNLSAITKLADDADQIFVCWGGIAWDVSWVRHVCDAIGQDKILLCWGTTTAGAPKHPLARGRYRLNLDQQPIEWHVP